jgi:hypothetical protein
LSFTIKSVVTSVNTIRIEHWDYFENEFVQKFFALDALLLSFFSC